MSQIFSIFILIEMTNSEWSYDHLNSEAKIGGSFRPKLIKSAWREVRRGIGNSNLSIRRCGNSLFQRKCSGHWLDHHDRTMVHCVGKSLKRFGTKLPVSGKGKICRRTRLISILGSREVQDSRNFGRWHRIKAKDGHIEVCCRSLYVGFFVC